MEISETINQAILKLKENDHLTYRQIAETISTKYGIAISENAINQRYLRIKNGKSNLIVPLTAANENVSRFLTETELRNKHDMFYIMFKHVQKIPTGSFLEENQMLKDLSFYGKPRCKDILSREEFKIYRGKVDGTVYYGHPISIGKLKQEGVLQ